MPPKRNTSKGVGFPTRKTPLQLATELAEKKKYPEAVKAFIPLYIQNQDDPIMAAEFLHLLMSIGLWNLYENAETVNRRSKDRDIGTFSDTRTSLFLSIDDLKDTVISCMVKALQDNRLTCVDPYYANFLPLDGSQQKVVAINYYNTQHEYIAENQRQSILKKKSDKIRVGLLSTTLNDHALALLIRNWLRCNKLLHDGRIHVIGLSLENDDPEDQGIDHSLRRECEEFCHEFHDLTTVPNFQNPVALCKCIRDHNIDIIFDVNGHTTDIIPAVLTLKPANIIVSFTLGTPNTFGTPVHDYILADTFTCPFPTCSHNVSEKIAYMKPSYFFASHTYDYPFLNFSERVFTTEGKMLILNGCDHIPTVTAETVEKLWNGYTTVKKSIRIDRHVFYNGELMEKSDIKKFSKENCYVFTTRTEFGVPDNKFVYASFNSFLKLDEATLENWVKIVTGVPDSVMVLLEYPKLGYENVIQHLRKTYGDDIADRFLPFPYEGNHLTHMRRLTVIDTILDSKTYNAHTTATDALAANTSLVTNQGAEWCSAVGASILNALGLNELITTDDETFIATAVQIGKDPVLANRLSKCIQERKQSCFIWNGEKVASEIQRLCFIMMKRYDGRQILTHIPPPNDFSFTKITIRSVNMEHELYTGPVYTVSKGTFGSVLPISVKKLEFSVRTAKLIYAELRIQKNIRHPGIPLLFAAFASENSAYFCTDLYTCKIDDLVGQVVLTLMQKSRFALQLLKGLEYLHGKNVIHRNICESNCIMTTNGNLQLTNFGDAVVCLQRGIYHACSNDHQSIIYLAPEIQNDWRYSFKSDVFAAAGTINFIFTKSKMTVIPKPTKTDNTPRLMNARLYYQLQYMMKPEPSERPNVSEVVENNDYLFNEADTTVENLFHDNPNKPTYVQPITSTTAAGTSRTRNGNPAGFEPEDPVAMEWFHYNLCDDNEINNKATAIQVGSRVMLKYGQCRGQVGTVLGFPDNGGFKSVTVQFMPSNIMTDGNLTHLVPIQAVINISI